MNHYARRTGRRASNNNQAPAVNERAAPLVAICVCTPVEEGAASEAAGELDGAAEAAEAEAEEE